MLPRHVGGIHGLVVDDHLLLDLRHKPGILPGPDGLLVGQADADAVRVCIADVDRHGLQGIVHDEGFHHLLGVKLRVVGVGFSGEAQDAYNFAAAFADVALRHPCAGPVQPGAKKLHQPGPVGGGGLVPVRLKEHGNVLLAAEVTAEGDGRGAVQLIHLACQQGVVQALVFNQLQAMDFLLQLIMIGFQFPKALGNQRKLVTASGGDVGGFLQSLHRKVIMPGQEIGQHQAEQQRAGKEIAKQHPAGHHVLEIEGRRNGQHIGNGGHRRIGGGDHHALLCEGGEVGGGVQHAGGPASGAGQQRFVLQKDAGCAVPGAADALGGLFHLTGVDDHNQGQGRILHQQARRYGLQHQKLASALCHVQVVQVACVHQGMKNLRVKAQVFLHDAVKLVAFGVDMP